MASIEEILKQGRAHHQAGRIDLARQHYQQVLAGDPEQPQALHLLGTIAFYEGNDTTAIELVRKAIGINGEVSGFHITLSNVLRHTGKTGEALDSIDYALQLKPDSADAHCLHADVLMELNRSDEAIEAYHRALALSTGDSQLAKYAHGKLSEAHSYAVTPVERRHIHWLSYVTTRLAEYPVSDILDIGSEIFWLIGIAAKFPRLVSIDIRSHPSRDWLPFEHVRGDILALPYDDASFDVVTMPQVLHWAGSGCYGQPFAEDVTGQALREVARVLRSDGHIIGATFIKPGITRGTAGKQKSFGAMELPRLFYAAGLELSDAKYYLHETMTTVELSDIDADQTRDTYPYPRYVSPYYMLFDLTRSNTSGTA